jgi:hypothetical protein
VSHGPLEQHNGAAHSHLGHVAQLTQLTLNNYDVFLELHHSVSDFILINLMCHMTLLSNSMELSMLTLGMLDMDLTLYNSDVFLELHHSLSVFILINLMCHMALLSHPITMLCQTSP